MTFFLKKCAFLVALAAFPLTAAFADGGPYAGFGGGASILSFDHSFDSSTLAAEASASTGLNVNVSGGMDTSKGAFNAFLGYNFNRYVGMEVDLANLGTIHGDYTATTVYGSSTTTVGYRVTSRAVAATGTLPFASGWAVTGKLGGSYSAVRETVCGGPCYTYDHGSWTPMVGIGIERDISQDIKLKTELVGLGRVGSETTGKANAAYAMLDLVFAF